MARKKKEELKDTSIMFATMADTDNFAMFQQKEKVYVFHWCGKVEKGEWFRKTVGWDTHNPRCEACNKPVPEKFSALLKIYESGM